MRFLHCIHAASGWGFENAPEFDDREIREFWRELARVITLFDLCSPCDFLFERDG
jgi:hypothetical protein